MPTLQKSVGFVTFSTRKKGNLKMTLNGLATPCMESMTR